MKQAYILLILVVFFFGTNSDATANEREMIRLLEKTGVLILGEKRGRSESARLVSVIVNGFTAKGNCINVGLEISSEEKKNIDSFMEGKTDISGIRINTFVTHKEYENMPSRVLRH